MIPQRPSRPLRAEDALIFFAVVFFGFHLISQVLVSSGLLRFVGGLEQWLLIALPVMLFLRWRGLPARETLRLRPMTVRALGLSVIFAAGLIGAGIVLTSLQDQLLMNFEWYQDRMAIWNERLSATPDQPLLWLLLTVAVTPAICEELAFRGVIVTALEEALPIWMVCLGSGILFGAFHGDPVQLVLAGLLGAGLAWMVLATGSLFAAVLAHFLFNTATILLRHFVGAEPMGRASAGDWLTLGLVALASGALLWLSAWGLKNLKKSPATGKENAMGVNNT